MTQVSSFYLHVPFCKHLCNYCDFYKRKFVPGKSSFDEFHQFLSESSTRHVKLMDEYQISWAPLETIYLGGGTPSLWGAEGAEFFNKSLPPKLANAEFTMEVDPATWTEEMFVSWQKIGLNRISIGTQTLNPEFLKIMDRDHSLNESLLLLKKMCEENWNYSLDFLLGIPYSFEKKRNIKEELDLLLQYRPKHISLYILNARSKYPLVQNIPSDEFIREEYLFVSEYLKSKGLHHYEVSNFSLPGFESRHNQKYWLSENVAALGPTGTGFFKLGAESAIRYKWKVSSADVEVEILGKNELDLENTYLSLRTSIGWKPQEITSKLDRVFTKWVDEKYANVDNGRVILTATGFLMLDSLMNDLF